MTGWTTGLVILNWMQLENLLGGIAKPALRRRNITWRLPIFVRSVMFHFTLTVLRRVLYFMHTFIPAYIHTHIRTYIHTDIGTYILMYIQTYLHTYILTYKPTYIHNIFVFKSMHNYNTSLRNIILPNSYVSNICVLKLWLCVKYIWIFVIYIDLCISIYNSQIRERYI